MTTDTTLNGPNPPAVDPRLIAAADAYLAATRAAGVPLRPRGQLQISRNPLRDPARYARLLAAASTTGRCPVMLTRSGARRLRTGWDPGPGLAELEGRDPADVLAAQWPRECVLHDDCLAPFGTVFPGLAAATTAHVAPADVVATAAEEVAVLGEHLLGLVPVARPADVPVAAGWAGAGDDGVGLSSVLRSWEDRFGAVLFRLNHDSLELAVTAPPWTTPECLAVAAEHYGFCYDSFRVNPGSLRDYARGLRGARLWHFWWK